MPGKDQEYSYQPSKPEANKASMQNSMNNRAGGIKDDTQMHGNIMQKENNKNKGSNKDGRDAKIGTEPGPKK